jgi:hypothetical protein
MNKDRANVAQQTMIREAIRASGDFSARAAHIEILVECRANGWIVTTSHSRHVATRAGYRAVAQAPWDTALAPEPLHPAQERPFPEPVAPEELPADALAMRLQADQVHMRGGVRPEQMLYAEDEVHRLATPSNPEVLNAILAGRTVDRLTEFEPRPVAGARMTAAMVETVNRIMAERENDYMTTAKYTSAERDLMDATARHEERRAIAHQVRGMFDGQPLSKSMLEYIAHQIELG